MQLRRRGHGSIVVVLSRSSVCAVAAAAILAAVAAVPASAGGYCVACSGPDATYRCTIQGVPDGMPADPASQIQCVKQLATEGGHDRCSIEKFSQDNCNGPEKIVAGGGGLEKPPTADAAGAQPDPGRADSSGAAKAGDAAQAAPGGETAVPGVTVDTAASETKNAPPRTVEEMAKNSVTSAKEGFNKAGNAVSGTVKQAGEQIEGAGSAIGNAAKKSWTCLTSLFSDC